MKTIFLKMSGLLAGLALLITTANVNSVSVSSNVHLICILVELSDGMLLNYNTILKGECYGYGQ